MTIRSRFIAATITFASLMPGSRVRAADSEPARTMSALAVIPEDPAVSGRTTAGSVTIVIDHWSSDLDLKELAGTPPETLLSKLRSATPRAGVIRRGSIIVADLLYAREEDDHGTKGHRIVLATDRPLRLWNLTAQAEPLTAPELTLLDLHLSKFGNGDGRLVAQVDLPRISGANTADPLGPIVAPICLAAVSNDTGEMTAHR